jgi:hypothetical protein
MSTRAASGINTTALRKKVVKPNVSPNPGRTLGCLMAAILDLTGALRRYTDGVAALRDPREKLRAAHENMLDGCHFG